MRRNPFQPANVMAFTALCVSVAFSSLPSAVADTVASAAKAGGIVKRAKTADNAKKLGGTGKLLGFVSTLAGAPVDQGTINATAYTVKGAVDSSSRVIAQAFCATT